jgi:hypothetical protein
MQRIFANEKSKENQELQSLLGRTLVTIRIVSIVATAVFSISAAGREVALLLMAYVAGSVPQFIYLQRQGEASFEDLTKNFSAQILLLANVLAMLDDTYYGAQVLSPSTTGIWDWTLAGMFVVPASFLALILHLIRAIAVLPALLIEQQRLISLLGFNWAAVVAALAATIAAAAQRGEKFSRRMQETEGTTKKQE